MATLKSVKLYKEVIIPTGQFAHEKLWAECEFQIDKDEKYDKDLLWVVVNEILSEELTVVQDKANLNKEFPSHSNPTSIPTPASMPPPQNPPVAPYNQSYPPRATNSAPDPATPAQKNLVSKLIGENRLAQVDVNSLSKKQASSLIQSVLPQKN